VVFAPCSHGSVRKRFRPKRRRNFSRASWEPAPTCLPGSHFYAVRALVLGYGAIVSLPRSLATSVQSSLALLSLSPMSGPEVQVGGRIRGRQKAKPGVLRLA
jgi:hypothetical protein